MENSTSIDSRHSYVKRRTSPQEWATASDAELLKVYVYYRTLLSSILLLMFSGDVAGNLLGTTNSRLFAYTAFSYTATNLLVLILQWRSHFTPRTEQIVAILVVDIIAIALLTHASNGMDGNIAYLLLICVAAGSIFLRGTASIALAGLTTILVLSESIYSSYVGLRGERALFSAGVFGVLLFATAFVFGTLSEKIRRSNLEALAQAEHAAYLQRLSQLTIERMRTGIIVVDKGDQIVLINRAARNLVGLPGPEHKPLVRLSDAEPLREHLTIWRRYPHTRSPHFQIRAEGPEIRVNFAQLEPHPDSDTLLFIEDNRLLSQEAQQLKLASLGRLTASIAHEVRNPLGAISHAAQLLFESPHAATSDKRLGEIIQNHSRRVNHIIENVLQLSRRKAALAEPIKLAQWLAGFVREYQQTRRAIIDLQVLDSGAKTRVDPSQLHQVLSNLCDNGLRYSLENTGHETLTLVVGIDADSELAYIEVIDEGPGIPDSDLEQIFEPFFTTESSGSGLGLYISRELCEANQATLVYLRTGKGKSCFRINFAHPDRIF
ncbi:sensor histidine kinase [Gilvimarinus sp. F26214L]|uniref:sensor histidine kinase n=1 Tax=Gilvimarinus sp. DZF01 TaxID=3461371 RepID=UPI0040464267